MEDYAEYALIKHHDEEAGIHTFWIDYETAYKVFDDFGFPWILDTDFSTMFNIADEGAGHNAILAFYESWMYDSDMWASEPPAGWLYMDERLVPDFPYAPSEEMVTIYLREEIQKQIDRLWELDAQVDQVALDELDWTHDCEENLNDLSDLVFEAMDYADDELVTVM